MNNLLLESGHYFGVSNKSLNCNGIILTEKRHDAGSILPEHSHQNPYFRSVIAGNWGEKYNRKSRECRPLTVSFHPSNETHSDIMPTGGHTFNIEFTNDLTQSLEGFKLTPSLQLHNEKSLKLMMQIYMEFHTSDPFSKRTIESLSLELLYSISDQAIPEEKYPSWLKHVIDLLDENSDQPPSLIQLADQVNIHPVHLCRNFKKYYNCTIGEYQRLRKLSSCMETLRTSGKKLTEIACDAGYYDQSHFNRCFKQSTGFTPKKYRQFLS
ncbi:MAG: helix-turn-helix transcriptional regulator [Calditrichaeota bacterium]|nr:helix-turn-helix transcriptional regulator [Calditrichota bacterium]